MQGAQSEIKSWGFKIGHARSKIHTPKIVGCSVYPVEPLCWRQRATPCNNLAVTSGQVNHSFLTSLSSHQEYKMLSYHRETALQGALQFSPKVEDWN